MRAFLTVLFPVLLIAVVVAGCATTRITNLTPPTLPHSESGFYRIEMAWESHRRALVDESIRPVVLVGQAIYTMKPVPLTRGRWETLVPVPEGHGEIFYRFKVNFQESGYGERVRSSRLTDPYSLAIEPRDTP